MTFFSNSREVASSPPHAGAHVSGTGMFDGGLKTLYSWLVAVLVRRGGDGKAQLVLLDHGLYETLKQGDRVNLCRLYKAIIMRDEAGMKQHSKALGVDGE